MENTAKSPVLQDHEIGLKIRQLRGIRGVSQTELANSVGVTFQQIQKYEKGKNRVASSRLQRIAAALEVPMTEFFSKDAKDPAWSATFSDQAIELAKVYDRLDALDREAIDHLARTLAKRTCG